MGSVTEDRVPVGIPCALLYFEFGGAWRSFLEALGAEPVLSGPTTRAKVERGLRAAIDEACLPVKAAYGHCLSLAGSVTSIFLPRVVSVEPRAYSCPKLLGLPDMIRLALPTGVRLLDPTIDLSSGSAKSLWAAADRVGRAVGARSDSIARAAEVLCGGITAYGSGAEQTARGNAASEPHAPPPAGRDSQDPLPGIGLIGHPYNLLDDGLNLGIRNLLAGLGGRVITPEGYPVSLLEDACRRALSKPLFWTLGRRLVAAAELMARDPAVDGIVSLASFGCGPDSLVLELASRRVRRVAPGKPFMLLTLDEHTGEAGLVTRLEAFVDLVGRRRAG
jgi:predicted nucleotide-binding protein (sugar kinase/HSP70/actin superfamily)